MPGPGRQRAGALSIWAASCAVIAAVVATLLLALGTTLAAMRVGIFLGLLAALLVWFIGRERAIVAAHTELESLRTELAALAVQLQQVERTMGRVVAEQGDALREDLSRLGWSQQSGLRRQEGLLRELGRLLPGAAPLPHEETPSDGVEIPAEVAAADPPLLPPALGPHDPLPPGPEARPQEEPPGTPYAPPASYLPDSRAEDPPRVQADPEPAAGQGGPEDAWIDLTDAAPTQPVPAPDNGEQDRAVQDKAVQDDALPDKAVQDPAVPDEDVLARPSPTESSLDEESAPVTLDLASVDPADYGFSADWLPNIDHLPAAEPHGRDWRE